LISGFTPSLRIDADRQRRRAGLTARTLPGDLHIPTAPVEVLRRDVIARVLPNIALCADRFG
jgi:hypothetical protein